MRTIVGHREGKVLQALLQGIRIKIGNYTYLTCEVTTGEKIDLATLAHDQNGKEHYLRTHIGLDGFVALVGNMTDDEFFVVAGNLTLNEILDANRPKVGYHDQKEIP